ncbi:MAG: L-serine ammonia-lyase [Acidobacteriia bacterium]|nr:L-serine ammonia-lyase [Terriglobia bacterium]
MTISILDLFKIGIGPSSSHTVGPMRAARRFAQGLELRGHLVGTQTIKVSLYGSLALTGKGHGTDRAVMLGLMGELPEEIDPSTIDSKLSQIRDEGVLPLLGKRPIDFNPEKDIVFHKTEVLAGHSNGMVFTASDWDGIELERKTLYSIGGGFVIAEGEEANPGEFVGVDIPYPFKSAADLLRLGEEHQKQIWEIVLENEKMWRSETEIRRGVARIWQVMKDCTYRGIGTEGILAGGLDVLRRAPRLYRELSSRADADPLAVIDWINLFAIAVNEENAAGGRVVTAPTNGAAGVVPAVAHYYEKFVEKTDDEGIFRYFLTAGAIGILYKENASISGAEVGCQGEVGVACSMAAGGLVAALNGTNEQVEHAAEIGMEHNLGMTCDPIGGLVQIPCIERNAFGAVKAVNAARMAMQGAGDHKVSLDQVIRTMYETGRDMQAKYKETSLAGLAVNVVEC